MRILGFSKKWDKLKQAEFTTFRFPRKDKNWQIGEQVQVVFHPRHKDHETIGIAEIINKETRAMAWLGDKTGAPKISNDEAVADGFPDKGTIEDGLRLGYYSMWEFMWDNYGGERLLSEHMNKLTLRWISHESSMSKEV